MARGKQPTTPSYRTHPVLVVVPAKAGESRRRETFLFYFYFEICLQYATCPIGCVPGSSILQFAFFLARVTTLYILATLLWCDADRACPRVRRSERHRCEYGHLNGVQSSEAKPTRLPDHVTHDFHPIEAKKRRPSA